MYISVYVYMHVLDIIMYPVCIPFKCDCLIITKGLHMCLFYMCIHAFVYVCTFTSDSLIPVFTNRSDTDAYW